MVDFSSVQPMQQKAQQLEERALQTSVSGITLPDKLRAAVSERFQDSPLLKQRDSALSTFMTSPDRAREDVAEKVRGGTILSPTQQQSIISARRAADTVPLVSLNDLLNAQFGSMGEIVNAGTRGYQAQIAADQGAAGLARNQADSALKALFDQAGLELEQQKLDLERSKAAQANQPSAIESLLMTLLGGGGMPGAEGGVAGSGTGQRESKPTGIPSQDMQGRVTGGIRSGGGQWLFNRTLQTWQPSEVPEGSYPVGYTIQDDETGETLVFDGREWGNGSSLSASTAQPTTQYNGAPNYTLTGLLSSLFGG